MPPKKTRTEQVRAIPNGRVRGGARFNDRDRILDAARACFSRFGVARTRLEDVASEAGISRPLLYQFFANRQVLMDAVFNRQIESHLEQQARKMPRNASFAETVVEASVIAIELARRDKVMTDLIEHSSVKHLPELLLNPNQPAHHTVLKLWRPIFERARATGELRTDLGDDDIMEWLLSVNYMFGLRDDVTPQRQRELLTKFVAPALGPSGFLPAPISGDGVTIKSSRRRARTHNGRAK